METEILERLTSGAEELLAAPSACPEAKKAAETFLQSAKAEADCDALIAEAKADIMPIDGLLAFAKSDAAKDIFGDGAANFLAHAEELKASGALYCDCPACQACAKILGM